MERTTFELVSQILEVKTIHQNLRGIEEEIEICKLRVNYLIQNPTEQSPAEMEDVIIEFAEILYDLNSFKRDIVNLNVILSGKEKSRKRITKKVEALKKLEFSDDQILMVMNQPSQNGKHKKNILTT